MPVALGEAVRDAWEGPVSISLLISPSKGVAGWQGVFIR